MNRRGFLSMITGAVAAALLPKSKHAFKTPWIVPSPGVYTYVYRNPMTGCRSVPPRHTFAMPEHDVIDVYRQDGSWVATRTVQVLDGVKYFT